jgi:hypothetical protein
MKRKKNSVIGRSNGRSFRWYSYDVWGNEKDGYEVNNVFRTNDVVFIPNVVKTDKALITYLMNIEFLSPKLNRKLMEIDGDEYVIYFTYKGRPDGELRAE